MNLIPQILIKIQKRIIHAALTIPSYHDLLLSLLILVLMSLITLSLGLESGFLQFNIPNANFSLFARISIIAFFFPSIAEELIFRVMMVPHIQEQSSIKTKLIYSVISLIFFIVYHPINALTFYPNALTTFTDVRFLLLAAILGISCTVAYLFTGSLWIITVIHWLCVITWLFMLGGYERLNPNVNLQPS